MIKRIKYIFETILYWITSYLIRGDHLVDCRSPQNDYKWGYLEPAEQMFYACFALLVRYVEKGKPFRFHYNPNSPAPKLEEIAKANHVVLDTPENVTFARELLYQAHENWRAGCEMVALYNWWKDERPVDQCALEKFAEQIEYDHTQKGIVAKNPDVEAKYREFLDYCEKKDDEMFARLINIRHHLWT